jgi:hypothetical protein
MLAADLPRLTDLARTRPDGDAPVRLRRKCAKPMPASAAHAPRLQTR